MPYTITKAEVWAVDVQNRPGRLARVLEGLTAAGAELQFLVARQVSANTSRVFVSPLKGKKQKQVAGDLGLRPAAGLVSLRLEGPDRAGLGADLARAFASQEINIRGASAATIGRKCVCYFAFKTDDEAKAAAKIARKLLRKPKKRS